MTCVTKLFIQRGQGKYPSIHTSSIPYISLSTILLTAGQTARQRLALSCSILEVVVDWSAKLRSSLWTRKGDLARRNRTKFMFFKWSQNVELYIARTVG